MNDGDSDYGSDFSSGETDVLNQLLQSVVTGVAVSIQDNPIVAGLEHHDASQTLRDPRVRGGGRTSSTTSVHVSSVALETDVEMSPSDSGSQRLVMRTAQPNIGSSYRRSHEVDESDTRPPLIRFRTRPMKAFSVTDLVSPSWCELQYFYTMKYHGKKKRTPAMKQGTSVHKELEEQIYTTVQVEIETKEDAWGLRIWNVIQGLRTLRDTGHTRELEVWGTIHGQVVNGVIDELSYGCPDQELEDEWEAKQAKENLQMPGRQPTISQMLKEQGNPSLKSTIRAQRQAENNKLYLCDVKTRAGRTLPQGASFRPTQYQLMVYHHLFSKTATDAVDFSVLAERYNLDANKQFSDSFVAQIGSLNDEVDTFNHEDGEGFPAFRQDSVTTLLSHNSLLSLWTLMIQTFQHLAPLGRGSIGNILKAEYRSRDSGEILGAKTFPMDDGVLERYIDYEMEWWKGERDPKGVELEDAFKCRSCDFVDTCRWRLDMVEKDRVRARANAAKRKAEIAGKLPLKAPTMSGQTHRDSTVVESKIPVDSD